jgi:hypothetical protein
MEKSEESRVKELVEAAIGSLKDNPLGVKQSPVAVHRVDGRWWVVLEISNEPEGRREVWDLISRLEDWMEQQNDSLGAKVTLTAA